VSCCPSVHDMLCKQYPRYNPRPAGMPPTSTYCCCCCCAVALLLLLP
jgi:hypothetical protein